ncbi:MAG: MOP flippase family protein [Halopseudomonas sp.]
MTLRSSAASGVRWTSLSMICIALMDILRLVILGRLLSPEIFGIMAMMLVIIGLGQVFSQMGLVQAVIQRPEPKECELVSLFWLNLCASFFVYILLVVATPLVISLYDIPVLADMIPIVGLVFLLNPFGDLYRAMLEKKLLFKSLSYAEIGGALIGVVISVQLALLGFGVWSLIWGQLATTVYRNLSFIWIGKKLFRIKFRFSIKDLDGYLNFGLHYTGAMVLNFISSRLDQLLIGALLGPQALGYYSMAFNLVMRPVQQINPILTRVAFPVLSLVQTDNQRMKRGYFKMINILTSVNAPVLIGVSVVSPLAVPIVLGDEWIPIIPVVQVLSIFSLIRSIGNAGGSMVQAKGRADVELYWNMLIFCFVPGVVYIAAYYGTLMSVAWALLCLQCMLTFLWYFFVVRRLLGKCFNDYFLSMFKPILFASAMGMGVIFIGGFIELEKTFNLLVAKIALGAVFYFVLYAFFDKENVKENLNLLFNK